MVATPFPSVGDDHPISRGVHDNETRLVQSGDLRVTDFERFAARKLDSERLEQVTQASSVHRGVAVAVSSMPRPSEQGLEGHC
jgi:hypothetical protein